MNDNRAASPTSVLHNPPSDLIGDRAIEIPGDDIRSHNPARPDQIIWAGAPRTRHVDEAVSAARAALPAWALAPREKRFEALRAYQQIATRRRDEIAELLCAEVGKPFWEAKAEAGLLASKVDIMLDDSPGAAMSRVAESRVDVSETRSGLCRYRPHGVMGVLGPFNFPAHLPNGHIVPALALGNTIVFKPSDKTPGMGQLLGELFREALESAGFPPGVMNVVQGAVEPAKRLTTHPDIDGILFTGSWPVGRRILEANLDRPGRIVALEMGGNNPAVVLDDARLEQAVVECVRASFATSGQRCTCTRRIILQRGVADRFLNAFCKATQALRVGDPRDESEPAFIGPVIRDEPRRRMLDFAASVGSDRALIAPAPLDVNGGHFVTPGVLRVDRFTESDDESDPGCDKEIFGPLVRVSVVDSLDEAISQSNATRYGLAASIFTTNPEAADRFLLEVRAGCVNVNTGTAGASGKLPFGGVGISGNHRPAGANAVDYCAYPVASLIEEGETAPLSPGMTFDPDWL